MRSGLSSSTPGIKSGSRTSCCKNKRESYEHWRGTPTLEQRVAFVPWSPSLLVSTVSFAVYALVLEKPLKVAKVFTARALFHALRDPLGDLPTAIQLLMQFRFPSLTPTAPPELLATPPTATPLKWLKGSFRGQPFQRKRSRLLRGRKSTSASRKLLWQGF